MTRRRGTRTAACPSEKVTFATQGAALGALKHIAIDRAQAACSPPYPAPRAAYRCPRCLGWHLTSRGTGVRAD